MSDAAVKCFMQKRNIILVYFYKRLTLYSTSSTIFLWGIASPALQLCGSCQSQTSYLIIWHMTIVVFHFSAIIIILERPIGVLPQHLPTEVHREASFLLKSIVHKIKVKTEAGSIKREAQKEFLPPGKLVSAWGLLAGPRSPASPHPTSLVSPQEPSGGLLQDRTGLLSSSGAPAAPSALRPHQVQRHSSCVCHL